MEIISLLIPPKLFPFLANISVLDLGSFCNDSAYQVIVCPTQVGALEDEHKGLKEIEWTNILIFTLAIRHPDASDYFLQRKDLENLRPTNVLEVRKEFERIGTAD